MARGVSAERLVFAKRMPLPEHLARHRCADLFLDTLPCNAHTTASDALWAGLPLLTCLGDTFAGRVAASLLNAIDIPELIATTLAEYEHLAIELATRPDKLAAIKQKLSDNRLTTPLFDTALFTRHLEAAYTAMVTSASGRFAAGSYRCAKLMRCDRIPRPCSVLRDYRRRDTHCSISWNFFEIV